jgi:hypothetical protein
VLRRGNTLRDPLNGRDKTSGGSPQLKMAELLR